MSPSKKKPENMDDDELQQEAYNLMAERAEADARIKERQLEVQAELDRRQAASQAEAQVADMSDTQREALLAALQNGG